ncbi:hypothetical protein [Roseateles terrae]|uniref:Dystroglycan-type cadherin-like domain-containing protein n=1 Tax=Roseateles terrae TaxID=431060 RepID=A0ABR6GPP4_9BURK|nr:hypothetical protein [Roseateles terrae]MBB3193214.1 hypothetical protein [Roseateles terrae]OWQ89569.1 hypothetical protein CDN98_03330 [Roseateles terrae]
MSDTLDAGGDATRMPDDGGQGGGDRPPHAQSHARQTPCVHCRRWRIFLAGMAAGVVALALHATAGPRGNAPVPKPMPFSLDAPELQRQAVAAAASAASAAVTAAAAAAVNAAASAAADAAARAASQAAQAVAVAMGPAASAAAGLQAKAAKIGLTSGAGATATTAPAGSAGADGAARSYPLSTASSQVASLQPAPGNETVGNASSPASVGPSRAAAPGTTAALAAASRSAPDLRLVYVSVPLPPGRLDTDYKAREVVQGGRPPYHIEIEGAAPPGLRFGSDGMMSGRPTRVGNFSFTLRATDSASPRMEQEQHYVLRILPMATAAPAPAPAPAPGPASTPSPRPTGPAPLKGISLQEADGTADVNADVPVSYLFTAKDLDELVPPTEADAPKPTSTTVAPTPPLPALAALRADIDDNSTPLTDPPLIAPETPTPAQLRAILTPLVGVEYPSRGMFIGAVEAERCRYFLKRVAEVAAARQMTAPTTCPRPAALRPVSDAPPPKRNERRPDHSAVPLEVFFDSLLAPDNLRDAVAAATKLHPVAESRPLRLSAEGCQCAPGHKNNEVIGVIPFWRAEETPMPINFNLFTRLQYMGVVLKDDGGYDLPADWNGAVSGFSREAQRFDVAMDLVVYRRAWTPLLNQPEATQITMINNAAETAVRMVTQERDDTQTWMNRLLFKPGVDAGGRVFGGLTIFFEDAPTEGRDRERYTRFLQRFVDQVLTRMQQDGRSFRLNLVVPDQQLGEQPPYSYEWLMGLKLRGERKDRHHLRDTLPGSREPDYTGTGDVTVQFLVLMSGDPDTQKKALRRSIDLTRQVQGVRRIDFLDSLLPVVVHATSPEAAPANVTASMARDFPYIEWNYGGIALWPLPLEKVGMGAQVITPLTQYFLDTPSNREKACAWICPNRLPLRLLAQTLLLGCMAAAMVYALNCRVRRVGLIYLVVLGLVALLTAALCLMLLTCDPALSWLRDSPYVPVVALVLVVGICVYLFLQFKAPEL